MRHLISVLAGIALVFSTIPTSNAEKREFEGCVYDGNITPTPAILEADDMNKPIATDNTEIGVIVECEDDTKYSLTNVIVYSTIGVIGGAALGVSIAFFAITSNSNSGVLGLTEYLQSRGQNTFELNPMFDFERKSAGLKFDINF